MSTKAFSSENPISGVTILTWNLNSGDDGEPFVMSFGADASVQVEGDFGVGGNVVFEGTNFKDGSNFRTLSDPQGNILSFSLGKIEQLLEGVYQVRPRVTAGTGVNVNVKFFMRHSS